MREVSDTGEDSIVVSRTYIAVHYRRYIGLRLAQPAMFSISTQRDTCRPTYYIYYCEEPYTDTMPRSFHIDQEGCDWGVGGGGCRPGTLWNSHSYRLCNL